MDERVSIAIVEDHPLVLVGMESICQQVSQWQVVLSTDNVVEVLSLKVVPDVILLDLDLNGHVVTVSDVQSLIERGSRILIVSALSSPEKIRSLLHAGVIGFASKHASTEELIDGIWAAVHGTTWTSMELAAMVAGDPQRPQLSTQEQRALALYASGLKLQSVARIMEVKPSTVKEYIERIRAKYEDAGRYAPTKIHLARNAEEDGYI